MDGKRHTTGDISSNGCNKLNMTGRPSSTNDWPPILDVVLVVLVLAERSISSPPSIGHIDSTCIK